MLADILTKPLSKTLFLGIVQKIVRQLGKESDYEDR